MNSPLIFVEIIAFLFCLYMARHAIINYKGANESRSWPKTSGKIIVMELWGKRNIDGKMIESENLKVKYEYKIDDDVHTGKTAAFYTLHYPETIDFFNSTHGNSDIDVYYNPAHPAQSVLIPGPHPTKPYGGLILASIFLIVGSAPLFYSLLSIIN